MIEIITGKPGAGKTYLVVQRLLDLEAGKYVVYHNIDGLRPEAFAEPSMIREFPSPDFFTRKAQEEYSESIKETYGRSMLIVIDEAQMIFGDRNNELKSWLSWHRHLGQDIWLITQNYLSIYRDYAVLADHEVRALKSSIFNVLIYQYRIGGESYKTIRKKRDPKVYAAYKSFQGHEVAKESSKLWIYAALGGGISLLVLLGTLHWMTSKGEAMTREQGLRASSRGPVHEVKPLPVTPDDPWQEVSYQGVIGRVVLVRYQGVLMRLEEAVGELYNLEEASRVRCRVRTAKGEHIVTKKAVLETPPEPGPGSPASGHARRRG